MALASGNEKAIALLEADVFVLVYKQQFRLPFENKYPFVLTLVIDISCLA
jgi:hypothetical protein